jgi:hypothetical protein
MILYLKVNGRILGSKFPGRVLLEHHIDLRLFPEHPVHFRLWLAGAVDLR